MSINIPDCVDRLFLFITANKVTPGNALAAAWDPDSGGGETFGGDFGLSADGTLPATHYGANTRATENMRTNIINAFAGAVPWGTVYKESDGWTWDTALADMGLQPIYVDP